MGLCFLNVSFNCLKQSVLMFVLPSVDVLDQFGCSIKLDS
ncbi:hypothetical protein SynBIOSU31_02689 [Synechococcus sp. BIOS-U3-1]|nr:hypothetical protein SynBIOSU31_02689 [Synechococcus sp. BIOS-U3-1]